MGKEELNKHPEADKYKRQFERALLKELEGMMKEADLRSVREKKKCLSAKSELKIPSHVQPKMDELEAKLKELITDADTRGSNGDITGSQVAMAQIEQCKKEIQSMKDMYSSYFPGETTCDACGMRYLFGRKGDFHGNRSCDVWEGEHMESKVHKSWVECRAKAAELKESIEKGKEKEREEREKEREKEREAKDKDREKSSKDKQDDSKDKKEDSKDKKDNDRSRRDSSRGRSRSRGRDRGRDRRSKSRDRNARHSDRDRDRDRDRGDRGDRDRGRSDRGKDRRDRDYKDDRRGR